MFDKLFDSCESNDSYCDSFGMDFWQLWGGAYRTCAWSRHVWLPAVHLWNHTRGRLMMLFVLWMFFKNTFGYLWVEKLAPEATSSLHTAAPGVDKFVNCPPGHRFTSQDAWDVGQGARKCQERQGRECAWVAQPVEPWGWLLHAIIMLLQMSDPFRSQSWTPKSASISHKMLQDVHGRSWCNLAFQSSCQHLPVTAFGAPGSSAPRTIMERWWNYVELVMTSWWNCPVRKKKQSSSPNEDIWSLRKELR